MIRETRDLVTNVMNLRAPQAEALRELCDALIRLPRPLAKCTPEQRREFLMYREGWVHPYHPTFTFDLATGVGKTRLAGAVMALLWLTHEAQTFLILAPRRAVLRRFEDALNPRFREYIFVDQNLVPEPLVVTADQVESPVATEDQSDIFAVGPRIYLLSPQLITTSDRFKGRNEFTGKGLAQVLRERSDLVVIADEAHHVGRMAESTSTAWANAIRDLSPAFQLGLTATPRNEAGVNVLYRYPLNRALLEGLYTKDVQLLVRQFGEATLSQEDVDRATIRFALGRLAIKEAAVQAVPIAPFPDVKPVLVLFARDQQHAEEVGRWLVDEEGLSDVEVLVTHSAMAKSEKDIERLLGIESTTNSVRVVVNVQELTEGWDVTNVFVVAPLRAMATFQGALQAMGRGLRLPAGRRVGVKEADTLDVVCFGKESLERIIEQATSWAGHGPQEGTGIHIGPYDGPEVVPVKIMIPCQKEAALALCVLAIQHGEPRLDISPRALHRLTEMVVQGMRLSETRSRVFGVAGQPAFERERFIDIAAMRALRGAARLLSDVDHFSQIRELVGQWLTSIRPGAQTIAFDPIEAGDEIARLVREEARRQAAGYVATAEVDTIVFPEFGTVLELPLTPGGAHPSITLADVPPFDPAGEFRVRYLYGGSAADGTRCWSRGLHPAYAFDSRPEAQAACLLDRSSEVIWWVRNEPRRVRLRTPAGTFSPDFILAIEAAEGQQCAMWLVEVKSDFFWEPQESEPRLKAEAASRWCAVQTEASGTLWQFGVALESDLERVQSWSALLPRLVR